jgi:hypothetical protein
MIIEENSVFERNELGYVKYGERWKIRTNKAIKNIFQEKGTVKFIKSLRFGIVMLKE